MKALKFLKNSAGISMVEVMMAVSVVGGLSLTVAQLMKNTSESTKQNEAKQENVNLKGLLQDNLNNTTACVNTFGSVMTPANVTALSGSPSVSMTVPNVKDKINAIRYSTTSTNIQPLTITSMTLTNYNPLAFTGDFLVNATFKKSTTNIVMVKPIRIPINFSFNGTTLTACSTMAVGGEWMLGGNAGTVDGTDYVGTSDNIPLNFRVNAQKSGRIDDAGQTFLGYQAGSNLPYGTSGTAFGYRSLLSDSGPGKNSAFGANALRSNSSGSQNTAIGDSTLQNNTSGDLNTAVGLGAMMSNVSGGANTALGLGSMAYGTSGSYNTAVGMNSVYSTSGSQNTGVGAMAIYGTSGSSNAALGYYAGRFSSSGSFNTYLGSNSAPALTLGSNNIFIGSNSGSGVANTSNKLYIESTTNTTPLIGGDFSARTLQLSGTTTINVPAYTTGIKIPNRSGLRSVNGVASDVMYIDNRILIRDAATGGTGFVGIAGGLGIGGGSYWDGSVIPAQGNVMIQGNVGIGTQTPSQKLHVVGNILATGTITPSDRRLKENIRPLQSSLKNISLVNGVSYQRRDRKVESETEIGVIAQDVKAVYPELISNFTHTDGKKYSAVNYVGLIGPVIEAIKELYAKVMAMVTSDEKQNIEIRALKAENAKLIQQMKLQQDNFEVRMKKLEDDTTKKKPSNK